MNDSKTYIRESHTCNILSKSHVCSSLWCICYCIAKAIVKEEDIPFLAQSAYDDACRPGNPRETSVEEIAELYKSLI